MSDIDVLQGYLDQSIPQVGAMGIAVLEANANRIMLGAPLEPNINHQRTAFGGSVASIATLACWGWMWNTLREPGAAGVDAQLVVSRAEVDYLKPLASDLIAICVSPPAADREAFLTTFARRGRARIELLAEVQDDHGEICARFLGRFVASRAQS